MRKYAPIALLAALGLVVSLVAHDSRTGTTPRTRTPAEERMDRHTAYQAAAIAREVSLHRFARCDEFEAHVHAVARKVTGAWGLDGDTYGGRFPMPVMRSFSEDGQGVALYASSMPGSATSASASAGGFSQTNVQEAGVDEPDLVKTDGDRILAIARNRLHYVDLRSDRPRLAGSIDLPQTGDDELLLVGDRALIFSTEWNEPSQPRALRSWTGLRTAIRVVDISDPADMRVLSTLHLEGRYVSARLVDGLARVVVQSGAPRLQFRNPTSGSARAQRAAERRNRAVVLHSTAAQWLPRYALETTRHGEASVATGRIIDCSRVYRPQVFSGIGMVTVVTVDPSDPRPDPGTAVFGDASEVYASATNLYVATNRWNDPAQSSAPRIGITRSRSVPARVARAVPKLTTQIHQFDTSHANARYMASGVVAGHILNQWALSEHEGSLRVATTLGEEWSAETSVSMVTVLVRRARALVPVGKVGGLGRTERIYAVRFIGDLGYVVTFRQVDPLYVLDLSDPRHPVARGKLKIPGYSAYLHPIGEGLLLGVGRGARDDGSTIGLQVSLFDVQDPAHPALKQRWTLRNAGSLAEGDHHAFLWWPSTHTLVLPVQQWTSRSSFSGAIGLHVDPERGIEEIGRATHASRPSDPEEYSNTEILRSLVVGDSLYTTSDLGMLENDVETFAERRWIGWTPTLSQVETFAGSSRGDTDGSRVRARFDAPGQIAAGRAGDYFVADAGNRRIRRIDSSGSVRTVSFRTGDGTLHNRFADAPTGVAVASGDRLYVATRCAIWRLDNPASAEAVATHVVGGSALDGACTTDSSDATDGTGPVARFADARQIAVAADESVVVADAGAHAIRRVRIDENGMGSVTTIAGRLGARGNHDGPASDALFAAPSSVARARDGSIVVADTGNRSLRLLNGDRVITIARSLPGSPVGVTHDDTRNLWYFTTTGDTDGMWVLRQGGARLIAGQRARGFADGPVARARFSSPSSLLKMDNGDLLVSDTGNNRLRRIAHE